MISLYFPIYKCLERHPAGFAVFPMPLSTMKTKFGPKVAAVKFYNHKDNKIQNSNEYTQAKPIL